MNDSFNYRVMPFFKEARPKVLVPEKLSPDGLALLRSSLDVDERKGLTPEELLETIPVYDALLVRSETKVTAAVLRAARNLKVVARAGVGVDNVGKLLQHVLPNGLGLTGYL